MTKNQRGCFLLKHGIVAVALCYSFEESELVATTSPVNATARGLAIELVLNNGSRIDTGFTFEYRDNAVFAAIRPQNHLTVYVSVKAINHFHGRDL